MAPSSASFFEVMRCLRGVWESSNDDDDDDGASEAEGVGAVISFQVRSDRHTEHRHGLVSACDSMASIF